MSDPTIALVAVGLLSISCQYLAYKIRLPAILPLLVVGILVGPVFNVLDADICQITNAKLAAMKLKKGLKDKDEVDPSAINLNLSNTVISNVL